MMLFIATLILRLCFIAQVTTQPAPAPAPPATTQQATTSSQVKPKSFVDSLEESELGQIIQGKKSLTLQEILRPDFWYSTIRNLIETLLLFIPRLVGTMIFLCVFWLIYRGIRRMAIRSMKKSEVDTSIRDMLATLIKWFVMGFGFVIACNQLGIPIVAMLTGVSIIGLAVGFAAQETLANFIAGIVIFLDKPFKVGDWIEIDHTFGQVRRVSFRSTRILNLDGEVIVLPNTHMLSTKVSNHTTNPINRVIIAIGISYRSSIDEARATLLKLIEGDERIVKNPPPEVVVMSLGANSVDLQLRFWIADEAIERRIVVEYTEKSKNALDAAKIEIPFPHMQLFLEKTPALEALTKSRAA